MGSDQKGHHGGWRSFQNFSWLRNWLHIYLGVKLDHPFFPAHMVQARGIWVTQWCLHAYEPLDYQLARYCKDPRRWYGLTSFDHALAHAMLNYAFNSSIRKCPWLTLLSFLSLVVLSRTLVPLASPGLMAEVHPMSTVTAEDLVHLPKRKDTCDMCSAAKVRCDKSRPICDRCERLGYPCFYSPARRSRKRHCTKKHHPQRASPRTRHEAEGASPGKQSLRSEGEEREERPEVTVGRSQEALQECRQEKIASRLWNLRTNFIDNESTAFNIGIPPSEGSLSRGESETPIFEKSLFSTQASHANHTIGLDFESNCLGERPIEITEISPSGSLRGSHNLSQRKMSFSTNEEPISRGQKAESDDGHWNNAAVCDADCTMIALKILAVLNAIATRETSTADFLNGIETSSPDVPHCTPSIIIKRVSAILICPCSKQLDVGLLAAAVCTTLLDTYEAMICDARRPTASAPYKSTHSALFADDIRSHQMKTGSLPSSASATSEKEAITQIFSDLPKLANLVTQFSKRYNTNNEDDLGGMPQVLAASITSRLRKMTNEVSSWVAQIWTHFLDLKTEVSVAISLFPFHMIWTSQ